MMGQNNLFIKCIGTGTKCIGWASTFLVLGTTVSANAMTIELSDFSESAITIGWDTFPDNTPVPNLTPITNQYQSLGIIVSSQELGNPFAISAPSDAFSDPNLLSPPGVGGAFSGTIVIEFVDPSTGIPSASFTTNRAGTKIDPTTAGTLVTLEAFDFNGNSLGTDTDGQGQFIGIESTQGISSVVVSGPFYTIDDFTFEPFSSKPASVSEPLGILGTAAAIGFGALFNKNYLKKRNKFNLLK